MVAGLHNALLLEVLAGPDGLDARQVDVKTAAYTNANSEADVEALVRKGAAIFKQLGG